MASQRNNIIKHLSAMGLMAFTAMLSGCPINAVPDDLSKYTETVSNAGDDSGGSGSGGGGGGIVYSTIQGTDTTSTTVDGAGNNLLADNSVRSVFAYDRARDSSSADQLLAGIDPNWFNGITRQRGMFAFSATNANENFTASGLFPLDGFGASDEFTLEFWFKLNAVDGAVRYFHHITEGTGIAAVLTYVNATANPGCQVRRSNNTNATITGGTTLVANRWYHYACVYNTTDVRLFIDGVSDAAPVATGMGLYKGAPSGVYRVNHGTAASATNGAMTEIRHSNVARYTGNFTPSRRFETDVNTVLLLHGDEGPASSTVYNAAVDTLGQRNGAYFSDGSGGNNLRVPYTPALNPSSRFTLESWIWLSHYPAAGIQYLFYRAGVYAFHVSSNGSLRLTTWGGGTAVTGASTIPLRRWTHVAASFDGTNTRLFIDGQLQGILDTSAMSLSAAVDLFMGFGGPIPHMMDELRVVHDAIYTANFTPRRRYTEVPNTVVMLHLDETSGVTAADSSGNGLNASLNASSAHSARFVATSPVSGGSTPPTGAFYSSASSGYMTVNYASASMDNPGGASNLTAEAWVYKTATGATQYITGKTDAFSLYLTNTEAVTWRIFDGAVWQPCVSLGTVPANAWTHIAGTYENATASLKIYINGALDNTCVVAGSVGIGNNPVYVGARAAATNVFGGYLDEVRLAWALVYTGNFTPARIATPHASDFMRLHFNEEPGGSTAYDSSGNGNHAALANASSLLVLQNDVPLTLAAGAGTPRLHPTSPLVTTGCGNITHAGGLNDDSAIELWITRGGTTGVAKYQWRKVGGASWSNAFNGVNLTSSTASTPIAATGVSVSFAANANFATDDHCVIRSWAIENGATEGVPNSYRGTANAFPANANIIATDSGIDIIDVTTDPYNVWMRIALIGGWQGILGTNSTANSVIRAVHFLNGKLYVAMDDLSGSTNGGNYVIDFTKDRADTFFTASGNSYGWGTVTNPRVISMRNAALGDGWSGNLTGAYARGVTAVAGNSTASTTAGSAGGRQWAAFSPRAGRIHVIDEYNGAQYTVLHAVGDEYPVVRIAPTQAGASGLDLLYWNKTQAYVGVLEGLHAVTGAVNGISSYTRSYSEGATPGVMSARINDIRYTAATSSAVTNYNTLYVAQSSGLSVIQEGATSGAADIKRHAMNSGRWPAGMGSHLTLANADRVILPYDAAFNISGNFTIEAWVRPTGTGANRQVIYFKNWSDGRGWGLSLSVAGRVCGLFNGGAQCGVTNIADGRWHHVAVTLSGTTARMYTDGRLERLFTGVTVANLLTTDNPPLCISGTADTLTTCNGGNRFLGDIDEVRISNTARYSGTAPGVPSGPFVADSSTVALFHFDEGAGAAASAASAGTELAYSAAITGGIWNSITPPTYDFDHGAATGNNALAVAPSISGSSLFVAVNQTEAGRGGVARITGPNGLAPAIAELLNASTGPALVSERVSSLACMNAEPDVFVGTAAGYTILNYTPF